MPVRKNETEIERPQTFLKLQSKSKVLILSHVFDIDYVFLKHRNKYVWFDPEASELVQADYTKGSEGKGESKKFFYWAEVDGVQGVLQCPPSVFYYMNETEKENEKHKSSFEWVVKKTGEGQGTRYETIRGKDIAAPPTEEELERNTEKMIPVAEREEGKLKSNLNQLVEDLTLENMGENPQ